MVMPFFFRNFITSLEGTAMVSDLPGGGVTPVTIPTHLPSISKIGEPLPPGFMLISKTSISRFTNSTIVGLPLFIYLPSKGEVGKM